MSSSIELKRPSIPVRVPTNNNRQALNMEERIGQRVAIPSRDNITGTLRYVGTPDSKSGIWAGIELDTQGQGKNDGSVQGKRYFVCSPNTGIFIGTDKIIFLQQPKLKTSFSTTRKSNLPSSNSSNRNAASSLKLNRSTSTGTSSSTNSSSNTSSNTSNISDNIHKRPSMTLRKSHTKIRISTVPNSSSNSGGILITASPTNNTSSTKRSSMTPFTMKRSVTSPVMTIPPVPPLPSILPTTHITSSAPSPAPTTPQHEELLKQELLKHEILTQELVKQRHQEQEKTDQLYEMLDKVQRERDALQKQVKQKDTACERLVSIKEGLSVQVQEGESRLQRLTYDMTQLQNEIQQLQGTLQDRNASLAKTHQDEEKTSQDARRIERLDGLVRELQQQIEHTKHAQEQRNRDHEGELDQVRRKVTAAEALAATLEKECDELRDTGMKAIRDYDASVRKLKQDHVEEVMKKEGLISLLEHAIADLKHKQSTLFDDEQDIDTRLKELGSAYSEYDNSATRTNAVPEDQRHRLEEQLELTMQELDSERLTIRGLKEANEQLKKELNETKKRALNGVQEFELLQEKYERQLKENKNLIEEADKLIEAQQKAEDERYQMELSKTAMEKEVDELQETHKQLEQDHIKLMDEMMLLEGEESTGADPSPSSGPDDKNLEKEIQRLLKENEQHKSNLSEEKNQVTRLKEELAELESLVENSVFGKSDLEERLEEEKKRVTGLEKELISLKRESVNSKPVMTNGNNLVISPTVITTATSLPTRQNINQKRTSSPGPGETESVYCELCESYGHDLIDCKDMGSLSIDEGDQRQYCDNCDNYVNHSTEYCPNQDETF